MKKAAWSERCRLNRVSAAMRVVELEETAMERLAKLAWQARGGGGTCRAEVNLPIRGYRVNPKFRPNALATAGPERSAPIVEWISFDGDDYWVRLTTAQGWPRTIRVTQDDVNRVSWSKSQADEVE